MDRQMKRQSGNGGSQNTFVDHLIQYRISPWPKSAEKRGFRTGVTDGRTDGRTDRPSYGDAFLTDATKKKRNVALCDEKPQRQVGQQRQQRLERNKVRKSDTRNMKKAIKKSEKIMVGTQMD